jgi:hypothetical protein
MLGQYRCSRRAVQWSTSCLRRIRPPTQSQLCPISLRLWIPACLVRSYKRFILPMDVVLLSPVTKIHTNIRYSQSWRAGGEIRTNISHTQISHIFQDSIRHRIRRVACLSVAQVHLMVWIFVIDFSLFLLSYQKDSVSVTIKLSQGQLSSVMFK